MRTTTANNTYPNVTVQWLSQALCFYQSLCLVDSEVLSNHHLQVAANRQRSLQTDNPNKNKRQMTIKDKFRR